MQKGEKFALERRKQQADITKEMLDGITSLDELRKLKFGMEDPSVSRMGALLMTGFAENNNAGEGEDKTSVNIPPAEGSGSFNCTLWLERVDARVKFVVTAEAGDPNWQEFSFQPREWRVCEVPQQTLALEVEGATGDYDGVDAGYFNSTSMPFEDVVRVDETALYAGGSFEFYVPENRKTSESLRLCAYRLEFKHPGNGKEMIFELPEK